LRAQGLAAPLHALFASAREIQKRAGAVALPSSLVVAASGSLRSVEVSKILFAVRPNPRAKLSPSAIPRYAAVAAAAMMTRQRVGAQFGERV